MAILHFVGTGVWGFAHTLPPINYFTHGSQVTVAHGHLAFFGAYVLLNLMFFYYAFAILGVLGLVFLSAVVLAVVDLLALRPAPAAEKRST